MPDVTVQRRIVITIGDKTRVQELCCRGTLDEHSAFHPTRCVGKFYTQGAEPVKALPLPRRSAA